MIDFSSFENRYHITANIMMEKPLHIGKGISLEPIGTDLPVIKTPDGRPYIPGSSIKGVLRTQFEKFLRTLDSQNRWIEGRRVWACNILEEKERCIPPKKKINPERKSKEELEEESKENGRINEKKLTEKILEKSCTACILFGSNELASKVYIKDAFLADNNYLVKTEIRDGVAIDRDTGTTKPGAKFDYEIVPAGSSFKFEAILENVDALEVGLFGLILKLWERGEIAIGGKISAGLGWGKLENIKIEGVEKPYLVDYLIEGKKKPKDLDTLVNQMKLKEGGDENA